MSLCLNYIDDDDDDDDDLPFSHSFLSSCSAVLYIVHNGLAVTYIYAILNNSSVV